MPGIALQLFQKLINIYYKQNFAYKFGKQMNVLNTNPAHLIKVNATATPQPAIS